MNIKLTGWDDLGSQNYDYQECYGDCPQTLLEFIRDDRIPASDRMLGYANSPLVSDNDKRLFAVRCVRDTPTPSGVVFDLLTDKRSRNALEVAERVALGSVSIEELAAAASAAAVAADQAWGPRVVADEAASAAAWAASAAAWAASAAENAVAWAAGDAARAAARLVPRSATWHVARRAQLGFIIELLSDENKK